MTTGSNMIPEIRLEIVPSGPCTYDQDIFWPWDAHSAFITAWGMERMSKEAMLGMLLLNELSKPIGIHTLIDGDGIGVVDTFNAMSLATKLGASSVYLATNNPGNPPYLEAKHFQLKEAFDHCSRRYNIEVVDHLVINRDTFSSVMVMEAARHSLLPPKP